MVTGDKVKDLASGGALPWGGTVPNTSDGNLWHKIARSRDITGRLKYKYNFVGSGEINKYVPNWNNNIFNVISETGLSYMYNQSYSTTNNNETGLIEGTGTNNYVSPFCADPTKSLDINNSYNATWHNINIPSSQLNSSTTKHSKLINHYVEWYTGNLISQSGGSSYVNRHYLPFIDEESDSVLGSYATGAHAHPANVLCPTFSTSGLTAMNGTLGAKYLTAYVGTNRCMSLYTIGKYTKAGSSTVYENSYGDDGLTVNNITIDSSISANVGTEAVEKTATFKWTSSITGQANNYFAYVLGIPWLNGSLMGTNSIPSTIGSNGLTVTVGGTPATGGMVQIATASITPSGAATAGVGSKYISFSSAPITISGFVYVVGQSFTSTPPCLTLNYAIVNTNNSNVTSPSTFGLSGLMSWNDRYNLTYTKYDWNTDTYQEHAINAYKSERYSPTYTTSTITGLDRITSSNNYGCIYGQPSFNSLSTSTSTGSTPNIYWTQYVNRGVNLNVSSSSTPPAQFFNNCIIGNSIPNPYSPNPNAVPGSVGTFSFTFTPQITAQMVNAAGPFVDTRYFKLVCYFGLDRPTELVHRYVFIGFGTQGVSSMCNNIGLPAPSSPPSGYSYGINSSSSTTIRYKIVPTISNLTSWFKLCKFNDIQSPEKRIDVNVYTNVFGSTQNPPSSIFDVKIQFQLSAFTSSLRLYSADSSNSIKINSGGGSSMFKHHNGHTYFHATNSGYLKLLSPSEYKGVVGSTYSNVTARSFDVGPINYNTSGSLTALSYWTGSGVDSGIDCTLIISKTNSGGNNMPIYEGGFSLVYNLPTYNQLKDFSNGGTTGVISTYPYEKYDVDFPAYPFNGYPNNPSYTFNNTAVGKQLLSPYNSSSISLYMDVNNNYINTGAPFSKKTYKFNISGNNLTSAVKIPYSVIASTKKINIYLRF